MNPSSTKKTVEFLFSKLGFIIRPFCGGRGHILMFHRVYPAKKRKRKRIRISANAGIEVTPDFLEKIILFFISRGYAFISLDQLKDWLFDKTKKQKFVIFTFDDGYADNFFHAYPVFKKYNVPFTIYVATHFPDKTAILWWYLLEDIILANDFLDLKVGKNRHRFSNKTEEEREETFLHIRSLIMETSCLEEFLIKIEEIFSPFQIDLYEKTEELVLSWEQICQLNRDPLVTIGAHTVNHFLLSELSRKQAKTEIMDSKKKIEHHIKGEVNHFAYPFGGEGDAGVREFEIVKECGFKTAVTTRFASVFRKHRDHLECLPRIFITPESNTEFLHQLDNGTIAILQNRFKRFVTV